MAKITHNISSPNDDLGDQLRTAFGNQNTMNTELYDTKVNIVGGKDLSTNDFTNTLKTKLDNIVAGAEVNVQSDWEQNDNAADDYIKNKPAELFSSVGSFHYVDLATITTPLTVLATVEKKITNDTASTETNVLNAPYGISSMWDVANNQLDFSQTAIGDLVTVIPAIEITTSATNQTFQIYIKMGIGSATPTTKQVYNGSLAVIGTIVVNATRDFTIDTLDNKDYPAEIYILSSANATVKSGELDIKVVRKDINVLTLPTSTRQDINLGTHASSAIDVLNNAIPNIYVQDQNLGQVRMYGVFSGFNEEYLFTGEKGYYGLGGLQYQTNDFIAINGSGGGGGSTNLSYTPSPTDGTVTSDTGTDATIPLADGTNAGLLKPAKFTLLESIQEAFTTALKSAYDGVVAGYDALMLTGSRLITSGEITKLSNTSNTNSGDETTATIKTKLGITTLSGDNTGDQDLSGKQDTLVSGTNIKTINGTSVLGSGDIAIVGGGGDMVLASNQTVSGLKTFLAGKFGLRNVANTFTSFFTNANTASRTYTLQNRDGTLLDNTDLTTINNSIATKMSNPTGGIASYLPKFLTATTQGLSRLWDTGTFFGIGTVNAPLKDISLGNQGNREIGIELSDSTTVGRKLTISGGTTINYQLNSNFVTLNQVTANYTGMTVSSSGNVYACTDNSIVYMQTGGTGSFVNITTVPGSGPYDMSADSFGNVYLCGVGGIYKQTGGVGAFVALGVTVRNYFGIAVAPNGDIYATDFGGDIYKQTGGVGAFVALGQITRQWHGVCAAPNGDIYAAVYGGDIYKQTGGVGAFVALGQITRQYRSIKSAPNGNIYTSGNNLDIYVRVGGTGNFVALNQTVRIYHGLCIDSLNNVYAAVFGGDIYKQTNDALGTANLNGGALSLRAGTGKGTGQSRIEMYTGEKTVSGTYMQIETLREYIDENGYHVYISIPSYANDAAADADTNLPNGAAYKITGNRTIFHKP